MSVANSTVPLLLERVREAGCDLRGQMTFEDVLPYPIASVRLLSGNTKTTRVQQETTDDS
jgi:hypothetical protein